MESGEHLPVAHPGDFAARLAERGGDGWTDGLLKSRDAERYARRFTPRRKRGNWTGADRASARRLLAEGRMTAAGRAALPDDGSTVGTLKPLNV